MKLRSKIAIAVGVAALITTVALGMVFMPLVTLITLAALTGIAFFGLVFATALSGSSDTTRSQTSVTTVSSSHFAPSRTYTRTVTIREEPQPSLPEVALSAGAFIGGLIVSSHRHRHGHHHAHRHHGHHKQVVHHHYGRRCH